MYMTYTMSNVLIIHFQYLETLFKYISISPHYGRTLLATSLAMIYYTIVLLALKP